ncbi:hypothetical protein [Thermovibrio sp.]
MAALIKDFLSEPLSRRNAGEGIVLKERFKEDYRYQYGKSNSSEQPEELHFLEGEKRDDFTD